MIYTSDIYQEALVGVRAKIFWNGRSQAVRLPKEFRFEGKEVDISREGGRIILEQIEPERDWIDEIAGKFDEDFARAALERPGPDSYERPDISFD
ncbi:MAG TPA: type II toxin-antitoxin system VapB family antitoxin [Allosphingosinicella sp.]